MHRALMDGRARMAYGGELTREYRKIEWFRRLLLRLDQQGSARQVADSDVDAETDRLRRGGACRSDDPHIIALARVGGIRLLCSEDHALGTDFVDPNLPNINWTGANLTFWSGTDPWSFLTATVSASEAGQLTFSLDSAGYCPYICPTPGGYYFLSGVLGALDTEGEWYYDAATSTLYFWAPGGVNPDTLGVSAKQRQYAFDLSGKSNVTIAYVNLFASTINTNPSSTNNTLEGINACYVSHYTKLTDSLGYSASFFNTHTYDTGIILWGSGNLLENSTITFSAGDGVALQGTSNTLKNNLIHHVDYMANYAAGISVSGLAPEVQNNTIYATGRIGIFANGIAASGNPTNGADIGYNNVFNTMMLSRDGGAFYTTYDAVTSGDLPPEN
ncbi:MAG: right-handed parallel beta-helix repeat-containing protein [Terriglobales bacterium]